MGHSVFGGNLTVTSGVLDIQSTATSTFDGGLTVVSTGGLSSAQGLTITGGNIQTSGRITSTDTATSSFSGGISVTGGGGLASSQGLTVSGGEIQSTVGLKVLSGANILQLAATPVERGGIDLDGNGRFVYVSGRYAYIVKSGNVGTCSGGTLAGCELSIFDVSTSTPTPVGGIDLGDTNGRSVYVAGRYAYVIKAVNAGTCSGTTLTGCEFSVFDISNPSSVTAMGGADLGATGNGVFVSGRYAYVVKNGTTGACSGTTVTGCELTIFDISTSTLPTAIAGVELNDVDANGVYVSESFAYVVKSVSASICSGTDLDGCELTIYNISDPASPAPVGGIDLGDDGNNVYKAGGYIAVVKGVDAGTCSGTTLTGCEFSIFSASSTPSAIGGVDLGNDGRGIYVSGHYAYVTKDTTGGTCSGTTLTGCEFSVFDISNPSSPTGVGGANTPATGADGAVASSYVSGRYAYITKNENTGTCSGATLTGCELGVFDVSGIDVASGMIHSLETGNLQVRNDIIVSGQINIGGGLNVGAGGIFSAGPLAITAQATASSTEGDGISAFFGGRVGIGTTTPGTNLDILGSGVYKGGLYVEATSTASSLIATATLSVASTSPTTAFAVVGHSVFGGNVSVTGALDIQGTLTVDTIAPTGGSVATTTFTGGISAAGLASSQGLVISAGDLHLTQGKIGIGTTTLGTRLEVAGGGVFKGNLNVEATSTVGSLIATTTIGIASSSPGSGINLAVLGHSVFGGNVSVTGALDIQGAASFDSTVSASSTVQATATTTLYSDLVFNNSVLSTRQPFVVIPTPSGATPGGLLFATTTINNLSGQWPILSISATTTGELDYARVAIGTTTQAGASGILDQLFVAGRINSSWRYFDTEFFGDRSSATADARNFWEGLAADIDGACTFAFQVAPQGIYRSSTGATSGNGCHTHFFDNNQTSVDLNPVLEVRVLNVNPNDHQFTIGFSDLADDSTSSTTANAILFYGVNTNNWQTVTRNTSAHTQTDTGIAISTTDFQTLRIEDDGAKQVRFYINGKLVATHTTNIPTAVIEFDTFNETQAAAAKSFDIDYIKIWQDDPPDRGGETFAASLDELKPNGISGNFFVNKEPDEIVPAGSVMSYDLTALPEDQKLLVTMATTTFDQNLVGVILHGDDSSLNIFGNGNVSVVISGLARVRVSALNGAIKRGDYLTSSELRGVAVKANRTGMMLGRALEDYDGEVDGEIILAEINPSFREIRIEKSWPEKFAEQISEAAAQVSEILSSGLSSLVESVFDKIVAKVAVLAHLFSRDLTILPDGAISVPEGENQISGSTVMPAGATEIFIANTKVTLGSKIFITPTTVTSAPLSVTEKSEGQGFRVAVSSPANQDIYFDWLIISSYRPDGSTPPPPPPGDEPPPPPPGDEPPPPPPPPSPTVDLKANDSDTAITVEDGASVTLSWFTTESPTACTASGSWEGEKAFSGGSETFENLQGPATLTYSLSCVSDAGVSDDSVEVIVSEPPPPPPPPPPPDDGEGGE